MPLPKVALPNVVFPRFAEMQRGPASGLAEVRNSLNATAMAVEGRLPKVGGQSLRVRPKLPLPMTNLIKGFEERLPWKPLTSMSNNIQIPLGGGGAPERGTLEGPSPPSPPSAEIPSRGSL